VSTILLVFSGLLITGLGCLLYRRRRPPAHPAQTRKSSLLPVSGNTVPGDFSHRGEVIHTICQVEEQKDANLILRVLVEMGKIPLVGLKAGAGGQLQVGNQVLPLQVMQVNLPWLEVFALPNRARLAARQFLRVPASFSVRFRPHESTGSWFSGKGINLSSGGFCFAFAAPIIPVPGMIYEIEMSLAFPRGGTEQLMLEAEVRWVTTTRRGMSVGLETHDPAQRKALANAVSKLQHLMSRHPEDYLLIENIPWYPR
jgi:hypothetical protein